MASPRDKKVPEHGPKRRLREVAFPLGDELAAWERREWEGLIVLARMLRTTPEALKAAREADDVTWGDQPLKEHWVDPGEPRQERAMNESSEKVISEGWDDVDKSVGAGGAWLKWADQQVVVLNVFGKPKHVEKDWNDGKGPRARILVDVFVPNEGVRRWEMSPTVWKDLREERAEAGAKFGDLLLRVKRNGSGTETRYKIRADRQMTPSEIAARSDAGSAAGKDAGDPF